MRISLVVAVAENGVIGHGNTLPWHLPADLQRFKSLTLGKPIVMGRKTHESIGRPLPGRTNIIVSRQAGLQFEGCIVVGSLAAAIAAAGQVDEVAVIGGAEIYAQALSSADVIYLTRVHASVIGDTLFPALSADEWHERTVETHAADERHAFAFSFIELVRIRGAGTDSRISQ